MEKEKIIKSIVKELEKEGLVKKISEDEMQLTPKFSDSLKKTLEQIAKEELLIMHTDPRLGIFVNAYLNTKEKGQKFSDVDVHAKATVLSSMCEMIKK